MLSRKSTATSKHSHHTSSTQASSRPSDDEREAFERAAMKLPIKTKVVARLGDTSHLGGE